MRDRHGTVCLLIVFEKCDPRAADGEAAAVQCVQKFGLSFVRTPKTQIGAARLKGFKI